MYINLKVNESATLDWNSLETRFIKVGNPGFSQIIMPIKAPHLFKHNLDQDVKVDLYRGEDGQLLCIYISYVKNGVVKPFMLIVHPEHQRQGIATMVINHSREQFVLEHGHEYNISEGLNDIDDMPLSQAVVNWLNKYIENIV
jgi:GNAT superfamily N-acetyltransferase